MKISPANQAKVRKMVLKEYQKLVDRYVKPLTNLPIGIDLDMEVKEDYFYSTAAVGHPHFGWIGLSMKGFVISFLGKPIGISPDAYKAYMYGFIVKDDVLTVSAEAGAIYTIDIGAAALLSNKIVSLNDILKDLELDKEALAKSLNVFITKWLAG